MNPIEALLVDGVSIKPASFAVPGMSLSSSRATMSPRSFTARANAENLVQALNSAYTEWVAESKLDDASLGGPQDELAAAGYPELGQVLENPGLATLVLGHYLVQEFLGRFTWDGQCQVEYWLDSVESCELKGEYVHVHGRCYSRY